MWYVMILSIFVQIPGSWMYYIFAIFGFGMSEFSSEYLMLG